MVEIIGRDIFDYGLNSLSESGARQTSNLVGPETRLVGPQQLIPRMDMWGGTATINSLAKVRLYAMSTQTTVHPPPPFLMAK